MPLPHNLRAPIDMMRPRPVAIDDRSGFLVYYDDLQFQFQYSANNRLVNQGILCAPDMLDDPAPFLQTYRFGPEPAPLPNARPAHWTQQEQGGEPPLTSVNTILD